MTIHTIDKPQIVNELHLSPNLLNAVRGGRRSEFSLLLAMLSTDATERAPEQGIIVQPNTESLLRQQFDLPPKQPLSANDVDYDYATQQTNALNKGGIVNVKLHHALNPSALNYPTTATYHFPEEIYHNLPAHARRKLENQMEPQKVKADATLLLKTLKASRCQSNMALERLSA